MVYSLFILIFQPTHMEASLLATLQEYGLSEKEAKIYLTALELGSSPASTIARRSVINRVTTYTILNDLKRKWYVNEITKYDTKYYNTISPDVLLKQLEQKYESFKDKVPDLLALADNFWNKPKIQFFEGVSWLKNLYNEILKTKEPVFAFLSDDDIIPELQQYLNTIFIKQRKKQWIHSSVIVRSTEANKQYLKSVKNDKLTDTRLINDELAGIEWELMLFWEDRVACALYSSRELMWYTIQSKQLYSSLKSIFMFMRRQLPWKDKQ